MSILHKSRAFVRRPILPALAIACVFVIATVAPGAAGADTPAAGPVVIDSAKTVTVAITLRRSAAAAGAELPMGRAAIPKRRSNTPNVLTRRAAPPTTTPPATAPAAPSVAPGVWDRLAQCESGGNWSINTGSFDGGLQFLPSTWNANGGRQFAPFAYQATREQQIAVAERLLAATGGRYRSSWPACSRKLGL